MELCEEVYSYVRVPHSLCSAIIGNWMRWTMQEKASFQLFSQGDAKEQVASC